MYGLEILFAQNDLKLLHNMQKKVAIARPPGFCPIVNEATWSSWLIWASSAPKNKLRFFWEPSYRIFCSECEPNAYREMDIESCTFTASDIYDQTIVYTLTEYFALTSSAQTYERGTKGTYYARNQSGQSPVTFGMAQALDLTGTKKYNYMPMDAVQLLNSETAAFTPYNRLTVFLRRDDRSNQTMSRSAGVSSAPIHLNYEKATEGTVYRLQYNLRQNRFEQV